MYSLWLHTWINYKKWSRFESTSTVYSSTIGSRSDICFDGEDSLWLWVSSFSSKFSSALALLVFVVKIGMFESFKNKTYMLKMILDIEIRVLKNNQGSKYLPIVSLFTLFTLESCGILNFFSLSKVKKLVL